MTQNDLRQDLQICRRCTSPERRAMGSEAMVEDYAVEGGFEP